MILRKFLHLTAIATIFTLNALPSNIHFPLSYGTRSYACQILPLASGDINAFILKGWLFPGGGLSKTQGELTIRKIDSQESETRTFPLIREKAYLEMKPTLVILPPGNYELTLRLGRAFLRFHYPQE